MKTVLNLFISPKHLKLTGSLYNRRMSLKRLHRLFLQLMFSKACSLISSFFFYLISLEIKVYKINKSWR